MMTDSQKEKWHATIEKSRKSLEDGSAGCFCGRKAFTSNFYAIYGDHNFYCSPCISLMTKELCGSEDIDFESDDKGSLEELYGEPGDLWRKVNNKASTQ